MNGQRLRPLGMGDIFDEGFDLYKRNFVFFLLVTALTVVPLDILLSYGSPHVLSALFDLFSITSNTDATGVWFTVTMFKLAFFLPLFLLAVMPLVGASAGRYLEREMTPWQIFQPFLRRLPGLLVLIALTTAALDLGMLFCLIPWIVPAVQLFFALHTFMVEGKGPSKAIRRSSTLVSGYGGRVFNCLFLLGLIGWVLSLGVSLPLSYVIDNILHITPGAQGLYGNEVWGGTDGGRADRRAPQQRADPSCLDTVRRIRDDRPLLRPSDSQRRLRHRIIGRRAALSTPRCAWGLPAAGGRLRPTTAAKPTAAKCWKAAPMRIAFFWTLLWLVCCLALPLQAATPQEYDQALSEVQTALRHQSQAIQADEVPSGDAPSLVAQQILGKIHSIEVAGQAPVLVDSSRLNAAIQSAEAVKGAEAKADALAAVGRQIGLLRAELNSVKAVPNSRSTVQSARSVLAGPEFASEPLPPPSFADRIAAWLDRVFAPKKPTPQVSGPNINPNVIRGIFYVVAAAAFALIVYLIVQAIGQRSARAKPLALDEEEAVLVEARDNDTLLARAEQQAREGDYRRAFRLVYLAALVSLDTGGVLRFDRSKTNWEYLRALRNAGRADIYAAMTPLTREFDQVWYGFAPTDMSHYRRALAQYEALLAAPQATAPENLLGATKA